MTTLYIIDNPTGQPLDEDTVWFDNLQASTGEACGLLLIGFSHADVIILRKRLAAILPPAAVLYLDTTTLQELGGSDSPLAHVAIRRAVAGLVSVATANGKTGEIRVECHGHAGQIVREFASVDWQRREPSASPQHPRLAFVSPLPPEATGIADYSAELLPYLAEHYEITLVIEQSQLAPYLAERFAVLSPEGFAKAQAQAHFDRVLYQVGNSKFHTFQFPLLQRYPGTVVLHDVYLIDAVRWHYQQSGNLYELYQQLFHEHGFPAVLALGDAFSTSVSESAWQAVEVYPANGIVTQAAAGLMYHSRFAAAQDCHWRPSAWHEEPAVVAHLRELPAVQTQEHKLQVREALGVRHDACLIASFGGISSKKMTDCVIDAFLESDWGEAEHVELVLVGAQSNGNYGQRLTQRIRQHPRGQRIRVTGYVERHEYIAWLQAADIAVQLRQHSRGESSGAILDAMAYGLAVMVNAHGSSAELPPAAVTMLPERVTPAMLGVTLGELINDPERCQQQRHQARDWIAAELDPVAVAQAYHTAIERFARHARRHVREYWLDELAALPVLRELNESALLTASAALCKLDTTTPQLLPRLLFDVSVIAGHDLKTGIERVTRRLADVLLRNPPPGWRVELIRWGGNELYLARSFASEQLGLVPPAPDRPYEACPGDVYLSTEWAPSLLQQAAEHFQQLRACGVSCYFTVHDLLPLHLPECFPPEVPVNMRSWFATLAQLADGITCVSATVAQDVQRELQGLALAHPPWVGHFHLGADFATTEQHSEPEAVLDEHEQALARQIIQASGTTLLMVGTLEPRKGHQQVLEALEMCWAQGRELNLVIVGKQGWQVETLAKRLKHHAQSGQRLFWLGQASDALLAHLYRECDALVAASLGEGFGLPLIEAAQHGIPIIARDIPVFREVAGEHADYVQGTTAETLAEELIAWHERWQQGRHRSSRDMPYNRWEQSAQQWLAPILADLPTPKSPGQPGESTC